MAELNEKSSSQRTLQDSSGFTADPMVDQNEKKSSERTLNDSTGGERIDDSDKQSSDTVPDDSSELSQQVSRAESVWVASTLSFPHEVLFVFIICMSQLSTQAQFLGPLILLREIGETFHVTHPPSLAWLIAGYSLTVGTFILFSGRLGDIFGYKRMLLIGYVWFAFWSMVVGLSVYSNYTLMVFARVLQGIGPAFCLPNGLAIFGYAYPPGHRKAMVFAFFGAVAPIGAVFGGLFGALLNRIDWPWSQYVMAVWLIVLCVAGYFIVPNDPRRHELPTGLKNWSATLDLPGAFVGVVALVLFNFSWTQAPISGWVTATALVPLILGLIMFGVFIYIEAKVSSNPLLPLDALTIDTVFVLSAICFGWANFGCWTLFLIQILEDIRQLPPLLAVAWFCPVSIAGGGAAVLTGKLLGPWGVKPPVVMTMALTAFTIGGILTATVPTDQIYWGQIFFSIIIMPFGMDMSFPAATLILSNIVAKEHQGVGASLINTIVNYGIALGVGFASTVDVHVNKGGHTPEDRMTGYRGGLWMGVGLSCLGLIVCIAFLVREFFWAKEPRTEDLE